ncbi:transmembrane protein 141-like [Lineus longissimus]|uniref:transmembrane protein 141-like n=1 Tax=Lineus longissimus TaxID=88925 RepID=UPI002B4D1A86
MNDLTKVKETYSKKFPHYESYAKCQSRAFMAGMATFLVSGAGVYGLQELLQKKLPYGRQTFLLPTIIIASITSYSVTRLRTKACQNMWMVMEDKHSNLGSENEEQILDPKG